ncbi:ABC transporter substrate-binding protein [Anoxybacillus ayderensis]|uniref:ABC transporter substrate-binding protein n=1 Tax=Anoxybacillus sp. ST70 TaxID=2864180 RepID=UPI0002DDB8EA|nr:ABC transporter substrate-binding protein [Anoxybacillus sp. ST70]AXM89229.1 ABC transporter substrate-binding protein [Anoxybacillus ayderensis G10]MBW9218664.1 ABC transporter substrate-binding protein [Anoxybacillus sp. ST70]THD17837.1 ABC transporter substrate-binding protein [Anoxybacillus ayderensis]
MRKLFSYVLSLCLLVGLFGFNGGTAEASSGLTIKDSAGRTVTFDRTPQRVVVLSPGDLHTLQALGVQVVGRPTSATPVDASLQSVPQVGNIHQPNFEKIVSLQPDVVIAGTSFLGHIQKAQSLGLKVVITSGSSVNDIKSSITLLGKLFNKAQKAKVLVGKIDSKVKKYNKTKTKVRAVILFGSGASSLVALPTSFSGDVLAKAGGENIAASFSQLKDYPGYANLSTERIIASNPDVIFIITHANHAETKKAMIKLMSTSSWRNLKAVKNKNVIFLPSELFAASPGVKITNALDHMNKELLKVRAKMKK